MAETDILAKVQTVLNEYASQEFNVAAKYEEPEEGVLVDGGSAVQNFNEVQNKLRSTRMIQQFLTHIEKSDATAPAYTNLFPTQSEYADVELEMAKTEKELSSIKKNRAEQQNRVKKCAGEYASEYLRLQAESENLQKLLRKKRIADQLASVRNARGNDDAIQNLATDSSLTTAAARALNDMLASDRYEMRNAISSAGPRCSQLRAQLEHAQQRRTDLINRRGSLVVQESDLENADSSTKELKRTAERNRGRELVANAATGCSLQLSGNDSLICATVRSEDVRLPGLSSVELGVRILELLK